LLSLASESGREVISVGKIGDIFAHVGTGEAVKGASDSALMRKTVRALGGLRDGGLLFTNLVDFDSLYGHRRDPAGYAAALEQFDCDLLPLTAAMRDGDLLVVTADHGCDPTWHGSDHTREFVPILACGPSLQAGPMGRRASFADIGRACATHLGLASGRLAGDAAGVLSPAMVDLELGTV
jgi:phosphopentomutase